MFRTSTRSSSALAPMGPQSLRSATLVRIHRLPTQFSTISGRSSSLKGSNKSQTRSSDEISLNYSQSSGGLCRPPPAREPVRWGLFEQVCYRLVWAVVARTSPGDCRGSCLQWVRLCLKHTIAVISALWANDSGNSTSSRLTRKLTSWSSWISPSACFFEWNHLAIRYSNQSALWSTADVDWDEVWENECTPIPARVFGVYCIRCGCRCCVWFTRCWPISYGVWNWTHYFAEVQPDPPTA